MRYVLPSESLLFATVTGSVDDTYFLQWLTDAEPGHPAVFTGDPTWTVTPSGAMLVDFVAIHHHNIVPAATVTLGGSLSSTIDIWPVRPDGISPNAYRLLTTPVSTSSLVLGVTGNGAQTIVGGLYAGLSRTLPALHLGRHSTPRKVRAFEGEFSSLAPYSMGIGPGLSVTGTFILTEAQLNELAAWHESQQEGSVPAILLPDYPVGKPMLVQFDYEYEDFVPGTPPLDDGSPAPNEPEALFSVTMDVREYPLIRWPV